MISKNPKKIIYSTLRRVHYKRGSHIGGGVLAIAAREKMLEKTEFSQVFLGLPVPCCACNAGMCIAEIHVGFKSFRSPQTRRMLFHTLLFVVYIMCLVGVYEQVVGTGGLNFLAKT